MHICFLTNEYPRHGIAHGGIGSFLKVFCPALVRSGHKVSVINGTTGPREIIQIEGVTIIYTPFSRTKGLGWYLNNRAVDREIEILNKETPIDILEGSEMSFSFVTKRKNIVYLIRLHGGHNFFAEGEKREVSKWKSFQEKRSFKKADCFIGVSDYVVKHTSKFLPLGSKPVQVIKNPINLTVFEENGFDKIDPYNLVFAGTIVEKKGIRQLCEAIPKVLSKFPQVKLNVYGRDWKDSKGNSYLKKLMGTIPDKVKPQIVFHGPVNQQQLPEVFRTAHVCVFPSHVETLGLVALEAMATGRAVIYTKEGPGPEVIEDGVSGWLCDPFNPEDIADKIIEVLSDEKEMKRRALEGLKKVKTEFDIETILADNIIFYLKMIKSNK
ncbi:glycosyltransferase involved in cell wall biosynthesis [Algoriphagus aquaeductus]|uniref:Glycosyltransferase involved in cell wall biosynthesis n=1 Tax=Algoriphagus aquaeductus TaxID=475299 RepID=A0A326RU43_9BACT|nr:glycosyltransferase family 4 protein [Algoriphagus aquaeductus]PZV79128.1 glycosyltransferase involved in cell wall biosynthesis [Algoriphagus aquaeductus]